MDRVIVGRAMGAVTGGDGFLVRGVFGHIHGFPNTRHHASPDAGIGGMG